MWTTSLIVGLVSTVIISGLLIVLICKLEDNANRRHIERDRSHRDRE